MIKFKLREAMDNTHMNIEQLHKASGISRNTISLLFHGKMKGIRMSTLCNQPFPLEAVCKG